MKTPNTVRATLIYVALLLVMLATASAQGISDEDIAKTAELLRANGQSEEQIQQVIDSMKGAQEFTQKMSQGQSQGMTEKQAARNASGLSDEDSKRLEAIEGNLNKMNSEIQQKNLARAISAFQKAHANKPDATVNVDGESFSLKVLSCEHDGEMFNLYAEGPPVRTRHKGPTLNASRRSAYGQGGYFEALNFSDAKYNSTGKKQSTGVLEGSRFIFEGSADSDWKGKQNVSLSVIAECDN